ncbi:hypothetical protein INT47_013156, partial [Mucor saturninus]
MSTKTLNINVNGFFKNHAMKNIPREPASPTLSTSSFSWITQRPAAEVKQLFKSTFNALVEKEKDLKLAAEVGKSLLENNTVLQHQYHALQNEFDLHQQESNRLLQTKLESNENVIISLESQNAELVKKYEATLESSEKISRQNNSSQQKLMDQVNELYQSLEQAYEKIQEHEDYRQDYLKKMIVKEINIVNTPTAIISTTEEFNELSHKIEHMMGQNQQLFKAKDQIQHQFQDTIFELEQLKSQFNQVQQTKEQISLLENKFQYQENHIHELTTLIEEYRLNLTNDCHSSMPSLMIESHSHASSDDDDDYERFDTLPQHIKGNSLHSELQLAFDNDKNQHDLRTFDQDSSMMLAETPTRICRKRRSRQAIYPSLRIDDSLIAPAYRKNIPTTAMVVHKPCGLVDRIVQAPYNSIYL